MARYAQSETFCIPAPGASARRRGIAAAEMPAIAEVAIAIGARVLWMQLGVENRCVKVEHARLFGGLGWAGVDTGVISAKRPASRRRRV